MIQTVSLYTFRDAFQSIRPSNFSYSGLEVLFDYFEQLEAETGQQIELDVIAICCEYVEDDPREIALSYNVDVHGLNDGETRDAVLDYLNDNTSVCGVTERGSIVYCSAF